MEQPWKSICITQRHIYNLIELIRWSFFVKIVNGFQALTNFAKKLHRRCGTGFQIRLCHPLNLSSSWLTPRRQGTLRLYSFIHSLLTRPFTHSLTHWSNKINNKKKIKKSFNKHQETNKNTLKEILIFFLRIETVLIN